MAKKWSTSTLKRYKMPTMPRIPGKGTKIAYKILGIPANIAYRPNKFAKKINRRLIYEETDRAR